MTPKAVWRAWPVALFLLETTAQRADPIGVSLCVRESTFRAGWEPSWLGRLSHLLVPQCLCHPSQRARLASSWLVNALNRAEAKPSICFLHADQLAYTPGWRPHQTTYHFLVLVFRLRFDIGVWKKEARLEYRPIQPGVSQAHQKLQPKLQGVGSVLFVLELLSPIGHQVRSYSSRVERKSRTIFPDSKFFFRGIARLHGNDFVRQFMGRTEVLEIAEQNVFDPVVSLQQVKPDGKRNGKTFFWIFHSSTGSQVTTPHGSPLGRVQLVMPGNGVEWRPVAFQSYWIPSCVTPHI